MTEKELAKQFISYFQGKDIYQEVPTINGVCDIMILDNNIVTSVEVKNTLNFDVIEQAYNNKKCSHYAYIAVLVNKKRRVFQLKICSMLGIGVIYYNVRSRRDNVSIAVEAVYNPKIHPPKLKDWQKKNEAGSKSERITSFSNFVSEVEILVKDHIDGLTFKEIYEKLDKHYSNVASFKSSFKKMIDRKVIDNIAYTKDRLFHKYFL